MNKSRCPWATADELSRQYHDTRWGTPCHDEHELFKMLILEGFQAGLAWITVLRKWDTLCDAFDDFDPQRLANYGADDTARLLANPGIIRNRLKVAAAISNAQAYIKLCEIHGSLEQFLWRYVDGKPVVNAWTEQGQLPAKTELSDDISNDLRALGFKFVGSVIVYSYLQAVGVVNDHLAGCDFRY
ncbi:MAG: DNA-3-methyladenine glycosylase I [Oscillospiraceae bacterium]|jgi:DNA-3-methyladenine glycosylase I|nr:DNA-3-methyladenine glycosylase I [Oscillospiraceae bacterium]